MKPIFSTEELNRWNALLDGAQTITLCAHSNPDGDAVGATIAMREYLRAKGKEVSIVLPNVYPDFLRWLPGTQEIVFFSTNPDKAKLLLSFCDLIVGLDFGDWARMNEMGSFVATLPQPKIIIDHHLAPQNPIDLFVSRPEMCATCEALFSLIWQAGDYEMMPRQTAIALYTGMMTDTGGFTYNSSRGDIFFIISKLIEKNIDKDKIYRKVYHNFSPDRVHLMGYVLHEKLQLFSTPHAALLSLTREEMQRFHFLRGDAEGLVNIPLTIKDMRLSIFLREDTERPQIRVSLRSVDDFPCNKMAEEFFFGGGHLNAAGGLLRGSMEEAIVIAAKAIEAYHDLLVN